MNSFSRILIACTALACPAGATEPEPQPEVEFKKGLGGFWDVDFEGAGGRTFFIQWSTNLSAWSYAMTMDFGESPVTHHINPGGAPKFFVRLVYEDFDWVDDLESAELADFDSDGIPNLFEIEELGSDPLDRESNGGDSNSNGLSDGWERYYFNGLGIADPNAALQPDGLTNREKSELGLDPGVDYSHANAAHPTRYTYDAAGRLTGVTAPVAAASFSLDPEGNITSAQ